MRNINRWTLILGVSILTLCLASSAQDVRTLNTRIVDILAQFPAENSKQTEDLCHEIIQLGPEGIHAICTLLLAPGMGDDTQARYALNSLSHYAGRPGAGAQRILLSKEYAKALVLDPDKDVQVFLIAQLQMVGGDESVKTLASYLKDERLCDPAARALLAIGSKSAEKAFLRAWNSAIKKARPIFIKALGEMQSQAAVKKLLPVAEGDEPALRILALAALANIGDPRAREVLSRVPVLQR